MSTWKTRPITCPRCATTFDAQVAAGLHITRLPQIRDRLIRGELHRFSCPGCSQAIEVRQPLIYTDFALGHWIEVHPADELPRWPILAPACAALFDRALAHGAPMLREHATRFKVRIVFGYDELREKIVLWDAGLDDEAIEYRKLAAIRRDASMLGPEDRLLVRAVADNGALILDRLPYDGTAATAELRLPALPADQLAALCTSYQAALATPFPDPFVSLTRLIGRFAAS